MAGSCGKGSLLFAWQCQKGSRPCQPTKSRPVQRSQRLQRNFCATLLLRKRLSVSLHRTWRKRAARRAVRSNPWHRGLRAPVFIQNSCSRSTQSARCRTDSSSRRAPILEGRHFFAWGRRVGFGWLLRWSNGDIRRRENFLTETRSSVFCRTEAPRSR